MLYFHLFSLNHLFCEQKKTLYYFVYFRGPTPFEDMIFYLWTDSNEMCTAYVKLKINHILFMKNF